MQDSRKKLLTSACFLLLLVLVLVVLGYFFHPLRGDLADYSAERDKYYVSMLEEKEDTIDVIMIGDSLAFGVISPLQFWEEAGITSGIAAQASQDVPETYYILKRLFKTQSPKVVIVEAHVLDMDLQTQMDVTTHQLLYDVLPVTRFHELWKPMMGFHENKNKENFRGLEYRAKSVPYTDGEYYTYTDTVFPVEYAAKYYLKKIQELCEKNGAKLLLVASPSPRCYYYATGNGIRQVAEEFGIDYIDMNLMVEELGIDWSADAYDGGDHLNYTGILKTSGYLLDYVQNVYHVQPRTEEEIVRDWNKDAEEFKQHTGIPGK